MQPHVRIHTCWGCDPVAFVEMQFPTSGYPKWVLVTLLGSRTLCVNMTMCVFSPFLASHIYIIQWSSIFIDLHKMSIQRVYVNMLSTFICSHIDLHRSIRLPSSLWLLWCLLLSIAISVWIFFGSWVVCQKLCRTNFVLYTCIWKTCLPTQISLIVWEVYKDSLLHPKSQQIKVLGPTAAH